MEREAGTLLALRLAAANGFTLDPDGVLSITEKLDGFLEQEYADSVYYWWCRPDACNYPPPER